MNIFLSLSGLFFTAFAAATVFPVQSEALLATLLIKTEINPLLLLVVASVGNILGSCVNWVLGVYLQTFKNKKWLPVKEKSLERAQIHYRKYGRWSLLLSWMPFIGDPITVVSGIMREKFLVFLALVAIAKTGRYALLAIVVLQMVDG